MPTERLSMRDVREILRQKWQLGRSHRQVAGSVGGSAGAGGEAMRVGKAGERIEVELFVAVLGAANLTYAEATRSQRGPDWIGSHTRAFAYFGGVTAATVCDQLKPGVTLSCRYEPGIQRTYEEMAEH